MKQNRHPPTRTPFRKSAFRIEGDKYWVPANKACKVGEFCISGGLIYVGAGMRSQQRWYEENCLINPRLRMAQIDTVDHHNSNMDYWPNYASLSPASRRAYLRWLASARDQADANISYVLLYFYGLERRLFLEKAIEEASILINEVQRLLGVYGNHGFFHTWAHNFLSGAQILLNCTFNHPIEITNHLVFKYALGSKIIIGETLSAAWAFTWVSQHPDTSLRTPTKRLPKLVQQRFTQIFQQSWPQGLTLKYERLPKLNLAYRAASRSFYIRLSTEAPVPDIDQSTKVLNKLRKILTTVEDELNGYSRLIGRLPEAADSLYSYSLLPAELRQQHALIDELRQLATSKTSIPLAELVYKTHKSSKRERVKSKQIRDTADTLAKFGLGLMPDPRFILHTLRGDESAILFILPETLEQLEPASADYQLMLLIQQLGMLLTTVKGHVSERRYAQLNAHLQQNDHLSGLEQSRLEANLCWLHNNPLSWSRLRPRLKQAPTSARSMLAQIAIDITTADGMVRRDEVVLLEKLHDVLELERDHLYTLLHAESAEAGSRLRRVRTAGTLPPSGSHIPPAPNQTNHKLDPERLAMIVADTHQVSGLLADVFTEEKNEQIKTATAPSRWHGLDAAHGALLSALCLAESWERDRFDALAREQKLFPDGALETLNEWAFDYLDAPIIEEEENRLLIAIALLNHRKSEITNP